MHLLFRHTLWPQWNWLCSCVVLKFTYQTANFKTSSIAELNFILQSVCYNSSVQLCVIVYALIVICNFHVLLLIFCTTIQKTSCIVRCYIKVD